MFDDRRLLNDLDKINYILVLGLGYVEIYLEQFFHIFELSVIFDESLKNSLVLLITDLDEILAR
jgi:hypothetical protein